MSGAPASGSTRFLPPDAGRDAALRSAVSSVIVSARANAARRKRLRLRLWAAGAAAAMLAGAGWFLGTREGPGGVWIAPPRRVFQPLLHELGAVVAKTETQVFTHFTGEVVWKIEEGEYVEAGTIIVRMDATNAQEDLAKAQQELFDKEEGLAQAKRDEDKTARRYALDIRRLSAALGAAQLEREAAYGHPTAEERREAELALEASNLKFVQAARDAEAYEELLRRGFVQTALIKQKRLVLAMAKADAAKDKILYDLTLQGATADAKRLADLNVADADKNQKAQVFNRDADLAIARANLELAGIELANFKLSLAQKERDLANSEIRAPTRGRVAFVDVYKGSSKSLSPIQLGETRSAGQDICKVVDTSVLRVRTRVCEVDVACLAQGQAARVELPAVPGRAFRARVAEIGRVAMDKNVSLSSLALRREGEAFVNVVEVTLDFEDLTQEDLRSMRLGLTARLAIETGVPSEGLMVPWSAVQCDSAGRTWVELKGSFGRTARREVKLGRSDALHVEIAEGLAAGEEILDRAGRLAAAPADPGAPGFPALERRAEDAP